jgi:hypothetical protein
MPRQSGQTDSAAPSATSDAPTLPTTGDAVWLHPDEKSLIEYLLDNQAAAGDNGNFKAVTFRGAATKVNEIRTRGGPKTSKSCEQKYRVVRRKDHLSRLANHHLASKILGLCRRHQGSIGVDLERQGRSECHSGHSGYLGCMGCEKQAGGAI